MLLEEKFSMSFDNPASVETQSCCMAGKKSHRCRDEPTCARKEGTKSTPPQCFLEEGLSRLDQHRILEGTIWTSLLCPGDISHG